MIRIGIIIATIALLLSCSQNNSTSSGYSLKGKVDYTGESGDGDVEIMIYPYPVINDTLQQIMDEYPQIGVPVTPEMLFDKNESDPLKKAMTDNSGSWEVDGLSEGNYIAVLKKEYAYEFIYNLKVPEIDNSGLVELKKAIVYNDGDIINNNVIIEENSNVYFEGVVRVSEFGSLTINPGAKLVFSDSTLAYDKGTLIVNGRMTVAGSSDNYVQLFGDGDGLRDAWGGVRAGEGATLDFERFIVRNSYKGVGGDKATNKFRFAVFKGNTVGGKTSYNTIESECYNIVALDNETGMDYFAPNEETTINKSIIFRNYFGVILWGESTSTYKNSYLCLNRIAIRTYQFFNGCVNNSNFNYNERSIFIHGDNLNIGDTSLKVFENDFFSSKYYHIIINSYAYYNEARPVIVSNNFHILNLLVNIYGTRPHPNSFSIDFTNNWLNGETDSLAIEDCIFDKDDVEEQFKPYTGNVFFSPVSSFIVYNTGIQDE
ncbi:MAG: hypothetical protein JXR48_05025 [Candidatus Delongbacteria bacterium]|nr:hypothetical protein [Candidatus Delongbacteria bacterium]MBN2834311.1 hypothetical protein [Candidatus Delongbacteria bacterium]